MHLIGFHRNSKRETEARSRRIRTKEADRVWMLKDARVTKPCVPVSVVSTPAAPCMYYYGVYNRCGSTRRQRTSITSSNPGHCRRIRPPPICQQQRRWTVYINGLTLGPSQMGQPPKDYIASARCLLSPGSYLYFTQLDNVNMIFESINGILFN